MKKLAIAVGFLPFLLGAIMNWYMMTHPDTLPPFLLAAMVLLILWCFLGFLFKGKENGTKEVLFALNLVPAVDLLLIGIQELIFHAYWMNAVGTWTQLYYLPVLNVGFSLTNWSHSVFPAYAACFFLMVAAAYVGCKIRERLSYNS